MAGLGGIFVVNLDRRKDRWQALKPTLDSLGTNCVKRFAAFDGQQLLKSGGRCRPEDDKQSAKRYTFSWTTPAGVREHAVFRPGKLCQSGLVDPWGRLGNQRSHLTIAETALANGLPTVMILEDDAYLLNDWTGKQAMSAVRNAIRVLEEKRPAWEVLMLAGQCIGGFRAPVTNNGRCGLGDDIFAAECVYQSHAYVLSQRGMASVSAIWRDGWGVDSGLTHRQRHTWKSLTRASGSSACFRMAADIFGQPGGKGDSDLVREKKSYMKTLQQFKQRQGCKRRPKLDAKQTKLLGSHRRGTAKISKKSLKQSLAARASVGGSRNAGNGRTAASAQRFRDWMQKQKGPTGKWPTLAQAIGKFKVSRYLYSLARKGQ